LWHFFAEAESISQPSLGSINVIAPKPKELDMSSTQARSEMNRLDVIRLLAFSMLLILPATSGAQQLPPIAEQMAKTYGVDSFGQIEAIRYTWNAELPGAKLSHRWEWKPKTDTVSYEGKDKEGKLIQVTYQRSQLASQSDAIKNEIDPDFINDQYWLILPFHVVWDGATVTTDGAQKLSLSGASAERIVVKYPSDGGYEPPSVRSSSSAGHAWSAQSREAVGGWMMLFQVE
jgi:hypothetical protein